MNGGTVSLVGRDRELAELTGLIDPVPPTGGRVRMILGDAGIGKTALVNEVTGRARRNGLRVLGAIGRASETPIAFASLHQLLRPVLGARLDRLPEPQRDAIRAVLGAGPSNVAVDRLLAGEAVISLITGLSGESAVLLVIDDAHLADRSSLDVLRYVARRLTTEQISLMVTARVGELPDSYHQEFPVLRLGPLGSHDANRLIDRQPGAPRGRLRDQVLTHAAGNPMALIELSRAITADPSAGRRWTAAPLALSDRLSAVLAERLSALPPATHEALLHAAVADCPDVSALLPGARQDNGVLAPAAELGLVRIGPSGFQFAHPLVRSAVYHGATFSRRAAAHRRVAEASRDQPDRRAWHLAAATVGPDDQLAQLLEATAADAQRRDGTAAAVAAMERAAELSEHAEDRARRFTKAALLAVLVGQLDLAAELATRAQGITSDPVLSITARETIGFALSLSNRLSEAVAVLLSAASEAAERQLTYTAWDCLRNATQAAYFSGTPQASEAVGAALAELDLLDTSDLSRRQKEDIECFRLWALCTTGPFSERDQLTRLLSRTVRELGTTPDSGNAPGSGDRLGVDVASAEQVVAASAWVLDDIELAIRLLRRIVGRLRHPGVRGTSPSVLALLSLCLFDSGRWDEALEIATETEDLAIAYRIDIAIASSYITSAQVHALRGDTELARRQAERASALFDLDQARIVEARVRRVLALADLGDAAYDRALARLDGLFDSSGGPLHRYESYPGVADLAEAFARLDRRAEGRDRIARILECFQGRPSPRLEQVFLRAKAILAGGATAEGYFRSALEDEQGNQWPFERARLHLDFGEWLRRRRRINEAKEFLTLGLQAATRLGATPSILRANTELRACGGRSLASGGTLSSGGALSELTPQQEEVVRLAARGLTNQEIGDRLHLSPRTVSTHLYNSYPKLGVTTRRELPDVVAQADEVHQGTS
ncbi:MAG TPA: AAA family ATPase [Trebonia sp.]|jgi:DNA-binding CsgD family transcriptional regulator/tetratricopeptide (TPR) repeat protein|nr:AAA family ATPase [Trebonia sp.]